MKKYIRLTKIKPAENASYPTPDWDNYEHGDLNRNSSLPVDYWVEGYLINPPKIGESVKIEREIRNGEKVYGFMVTSPVTKIDGDFFETLNSIYKIEYLKEKSAK